MLEALTFTLVALPVHRAILSNGVLSGMSALTVGPVRAVSAFVALAEVYSLGFYLTFGLVESQLSLVAIFILSQFLLWIVFGALSPDIARNRL